jgi:hypothetical protein
VPIPTPKISSTPAPTVQELVLHETLDDAEIAGADAHSPISQPAIANSDKDEPLDQGFQGFQAFPFSPPIPKTPLPKPISTSSCNICHIPFSFLVSHQCCGECDREVCSGCSVKATNQWWGLSSMRLCNTCNEIHVVWSSLRDADFATDALAWSERQRQDSLGALGERIGAGAFSTVHVVTVPVKSTSGRNNTRRFAAKLIHKKNRLVREARCISEEVSAMRKVGAGCGE